MAPGSQLFRRSSSCINKWAFPFKIKTIR
jgi:hypothetical protein